MRYAYCGTTPSMFFSFLVGRWVIAPRGVMRRI